MPSTLVRKDPHTWFNLGVTSWANSGSRDLHLDLREVITPGARGARELLLTALRDAVRSGRLAPGSMLPPSRSLAADLGLARNTVAEAYAELVAEGWLASRQGAGTWVLNPGGAQAPPRPRGVRGDARPQPDARLPRRVGVSARPSGLASTRRALSTAPTEALRMGDARGRPELRDALAEYLARARGVRTSAESVVVCAGVRHAVELLGAGVSRARARSPSRPTGCSSSATRSPRWRCRRCRSASTNAGRSSAISTVSRRPPCC